MVCDAPPLCTPYPPSPALSSAACLCTQAIAAAHENVAPADVSLSEGELLGANINRSPSAYAANPAVERSRYAHDVDKTMTLLSVARPGCGGTTAGLLSWFPVHATSMNNTNPLISGDNKGAAALAVEAVARRCDRSGNSSSAVHGGGGPASVVAGWWGWLLHLLGGALWSNGSANACGGGGGTGVLQLVARMLLRPNSEACRTGRASNDTACAHRLLDPGVIAAFAQSSVGDTTPNVQGAFCLDTGG
jgi:neutral ceramidase